MADKIAFQKRSDFQLCRALGLVILTLTMDRVILQTVMHHSSTSTYKPNFIEIEETFVDGRTDGHLRPALIGRLCRRVNLKTE